MSTTPQERLLNIAEQIACASYMVSGSPDLVELRAAIAEVKSAAPVPASTGREAELMTLLRTLVAGDAGQTVLYKLSTGQSTNTHDGRAWLAAKALVDGTPVAARELDVEAERREFEAWARGKYYSLELYSFPEYRDGPTQRAWEIWQAARSAAQSTAPDQEQAGDAWKELVSAANATVERWHSKDWKQPHTAEFINRLALAIGAVKGAVAPSPNNSPVGGKD